MYAPRLKSVYRPVHVDVRTVCLGHPGTPRSAPIADPDGGVRTVLALLDGSRSVPEVVARTAGRLDADDVAGLVATLAAGGFLEDAADVPPSGLTAEQEQRLARNGEFFSYFTDGAPDLAGPGVENLPSTRHTPQLALRHATVTVLGVGGVGSHVARHLAALGVGRLHLVDPGVVEAADLGHHALATPADVGRPVAEVTAHHLRALVPDLEVTAHVVRIASPADAAAFLATADLTVCTADRPGGELDRWVNAASLAHRLPWLRAGLVGLAAELDLVAPGRTSCVECRLEPAGSPTADRVVDDDVTATGPRPASPSIAPVAGLLGSLTALEAAKVLTGTTATVLLDARLVVDLAAAGVQHVPSPPRPDCPACGHLQAPGRRTRREAGDGAVSGRA